MADGNVIPIKHRKPNQIADLDRVRKPAAHLLLGRNLSLLAGRLDFDSRGLLTIRGLCHDQGWPQVMFSGMQQTAVEQEKAAQKR
jgi:hypothetical protein